MKLNFKECKKESALKKASILFLLFLFLLSTQVFAKNTISDPDPPSKTEKTVIFVSESTIIYNSSDLGNAKTISKTPESSVSEDNLQKVEIFVSEGALIYNAEAFSNTKITKLVSSKKTLTNKKVQKTNKAVTKHTEKIKNNPPTEYINTLKDSSVFSQNQKEKILFSVPTIQSSVKNVIKEDNNSFQNRNFNGQKHKFTYKNPIISFCHFSGKYRVRPPTFYG